MHWSWMIETVEVVGVGLRSVGEDGSRHGVHGAVVEVVPGKWHVPQFRSGVEVVVELFRRVIDDDGRAEGQGQADQQ